MILYGGSLSLAALLCGALLAINAKSAELVAYWSFDENGGTVANDSVGGNAGNIRGEAKWVRGKAGSALEFNKGFVEVKDSDSLHLTSMTLSAWIYPTAYPKDQDPIWWAGIVGKAYNTESTYGMMLGPSRKIHFNACGPFGEGGKPAAL